MFEKNIKELEKKNPELAKKIKDYPYDKIKTVEVYESESKNIIISYKGILLHSNEDPIREAKSLWHKTVKNELKTNDIQLVYGIGLGYLFKRAYVSANSKILLFEPSLDILRFVFENVDFSPELADERVFIVDTQEDVTDFFERKYISGDKIEVLFLPSYLELDQKGLLELSNNLFQTIKDKNIDQNTALMMSKLTTKNLLYRIFNISKYNPVNTLTNSCKNKTALILAAGPSLQNDLKLIKANREKFIVIAILPTLTILKDNNIEPDFVTVADPTYQIPKIEKHKDQLQTMNFVNESRADLYLDHLNVNSSFVYFPSVDKISQTILGAVPNNPIELLPPCASVSILSFRLAQLLGCKKIIFSGLDLAMTDDKLYSGSNIQIVNKSEKKLTLTEGYGEYTVQLTTTASADGSEVKTREDYVLFIKEFEKIVQENPEIEMINTAIKGALIQGMTYETMEKAVKNLEKIGIDLDIVIEKAKKSNLKDFKKEALKIIKETKISFVKAGELIAKASISATELINELSLETPDMDKFEKLYTESKSVFSASRTFATEDIILSTYMQTEILEFITTYHKEASITLEILKLNLEIEKKLFEKTLKSIEDLTPIIDAIIEQG